MKNIKYLFLTIVLLIPIALITTGCTDDSMDNIEIIVTNYPNEYITSTYLQKGVDDAYDKLKIELSELDADYRVAVESTEHKTIIVADSALKYLEKFGLDVICIDSDANQKTLSQAEKAVKNKNVSYIMLFKGEEVNENAKKLLDTYTDIQKLELHKLDNISDTERSNKENYNTIMRSNLELIKKELYQ